MDILKSGELVHKLRNGDGAAFESIYKAYFRKLSTYAATFLPSEECEEVVQDTMLWLWENSATLHPEMSLHSLLFTIVKNKCLNRLNQLNTRHRVHEKLYEAFAKQEQQTACTYDFEELEKRLSEALDRLPEEQRRAFVLNRFQNQSYQEIAHREGVSPKTVAYRIAQSLKLLRVVFRDYLLFSLF